VLEGLRHGSYVTIDSLFESGLIESGRSPKRLAIVGPTGTTDPIMVSDKST